MATIDAVYTPLRALLRDEAGQTTNEWSTSTLLGYCTDGVQEARRELSLADADYFLAVVTFSLTSGQQSYTPATDIRKIVKIQRVDTSPPTAVQPTTMEDSLSLDQVTADATGAWQTYYLFTGTDIRIFPLPTSNISNAVRILYEQEIVPSGGYTTTTTTLSLPDDWIRFAIYAAACTALLQDEQSPDTIWRVKDQILKRLRVDYRDRNKGRTKFVRYVQPYGDFDYPWGG